MNARCRAVPLVTLTFSLIAATAPGDTAPTTAATTLATRPDEATLIAFRQWWYACAPYPADDAVRRLFDSPDEAAGGEALFWKTKHQLRAHAYTMNVEALRLAQQAIVRAAASGYRPASAEVIWSTIAERRFTGEHDRDRLILALANLLKQRVPDAADYLGQIYRDGSGGMKPDLALAEQSFRAAIQLGDKRAYVELARTQKLSGELHAAVRSAQSGADAGDARAEWTLGGWYLPGRMTGPDLAKAEAHFRRAAEQGFAPAQLDLARMLLQSGRRAEGERYLDDAASSGLPDAVELKRRWSTSNHRPADATAS